MSAHKFKRPADSPIDNWVDRLAPERTRDYLRLIRADRPVGTWLLLWPCWWGLALATAAQPDGTQVAILGSIQAWIPDWRLLLAFAAGAFVMRGAGCIINDIIDRDIDPKVDRTAGRPIASGALTVPIAVVFLVIHGLIGLSILVSLNLTTILLGLASLPLIVVYPFMKRVTYWPQAALGVTFNWGALMGWTAVTGAWPSWPAFALYTGCLAWTLGYDTIYAHQDRADDLQIGVKSSALKLGDRTKPFLWLIYGIAVIFFGLAGASAGLGAYFYVGLAIAWCHFAWQILRLDIDDRAICSAVFRSNIGLGAIIFLAIVVGRGL